MLGSCPICDANIKITSVEVSEIISCKDCGSKLEVVSVDNKSSKFNLKEAPKVEEDWGQ
ncbi:lysine biosynthesis protein LysW [Candidatus Gottesmanbacteria bacterium]|nr:lysine biosynthesis protein LysW [Candidatus Gottesmanbacteria bacterium]